MKKLLLLIGLVVLFAPLVHAGQYDGEWKKKSISNYCSNFFNWDKSILIIKNNKATYRLFNTNGWTEDFRGKVRKNKIGINSDVATLTGKINNNKISMKFSNIMESWEWKKMLSKCTLEFVKVDQKNTPTIALEDKFVYCQNDYNRNLLSKRYQRCDSSETTISENKYNNLKGIAKTTKESQLPKCKIVDRKVITKTACYGTLTWSNGANYVGEFKNDKRHGQGTYTWSNGANYVGEYKDDKSHGQGTITWASGSKYVGEWKDNKFHGQGTYTWSNGEKYLGEFKNDKSHGQGTYTWSNGANYVGEFKNDKRHGKGIYTYADGRIKRGEWKNGEYIEESSTTKVVKVKPKTTTTKKKIEQTVTAEKDTKGPQIIVSKTFIANQNMTVNIKGRVEDDSKIVSLTIDGDQVAFTQGRFNQILYVLPNGQDIEIVAIDKFANQSKTIVKLQRAALQIQTVVFDKLNPSAIKVPLNNNAVALIIGVEDYENTFKAMYAKQDALFFNDFVHQAFGVPRYNIKLLTNASARRNDTLRLTANWLPKIIKENKTDFYLFFSGHGLASSDGEDLFLLPYDGYPDTLDDTALLRNKIFKSIADLNPKSVTVFLDTCYSGTTRSNEMLLAARPIMIEVQEQDIPINFTVFSASANNEIAGVLPEAEHGLFSYYLMKGLEGLADKNNDQQITNGELHAFINKQVSRQANQTPQLSGNPNQVLVQW